MGEFDSVEEFECAKEIDQCNAVKHWVRNLPIENWGYHLPLSSKRNFYPDFVALLEDGRILVVEYKGAHLAEGEKEKENIGELWEEKSNGKALFLWAVKRDAQGRNVHRQITEKVKQRH